MEDNRVPSDFLPLRPVDFHVLLAMVTRDRHGYGIVLDIETRTDGRIRLVPGNLYPILRRLVQDGLLEEGVEPPAEALDHKQRRYYRLSTLGRGVAAAEAARMKVLVKTSELQGLLEEGAEA